MLKRLATLELLLLLLVGLVFAQGSPTTSTQISATTGPAYVVFYYIPNKQLVWEGKAICNEFTGKLTLTFIQPNVDPDTNAYFPGACTLTGSGNGPFTVTTTATADNPLTFTDSDGEPEAITSLGWTASCVPVVGSRTCKWQASPANGMSVNYQQ